MKEKTKYRLLYILLALPLPVALLGEFLTFLWLVGSVLKPSHPLEILLAATGTVIGAAYIVTYIFSFIKTKGKGRITAISFLPLAICIAAGLYLLLLIPAGHYLSELRQDFGFSKSKFTVIEEKDTHGGFIGDGDYYLILDCSKNREKALETVKDWNKLPLPEELDAFTCGEEKGNEDKIPEVRNGYYKFKDRHTESANPSDASCINDRGSYNFSLAVYDTDNDILYFYKLDT